AHAPLGHRAATRRRDPSRRRTPQSHTLSLHDALPISHGEVDAAFLRRSQQVQYGVGRAAHGNIQRHRILECFESGDVAWQRGFRSEEHTSELQSRENLVCRLLREKKKLTEQAVASYAA